MTTNPPQPSNLDRLQFTFIRGLQAEYKRKFKNYKDFTFDLFMYQYEFTSSTKSGHIDVFSFDFNKGNVKTTNHYRAFLALLDELEVPYREKETEPKPGQAQGRYHSLEVITDSLEEAIQSAGIDNVIRRYEDKVRSMPQLGVIPGIRKPQVGEQDRSVKRGAPPPPPRDAPKPPPHEKPENVVPPPPLPRDAPTPPHRRVGKKAAAQKVNLLLRTEKAFMAQKLDLALRQEALKIAEEEAKEEKQKKILQTKQAQLQKQMNTLEDKTKKLEAGISALISAEDLEVKKKTLQAEVTAQAEKKLTAAAKPVITQAYKLEKQTEGKNKNQAQQTLEAKLELQEKQLRAQAELLLGEEADERVQAVQEAIREQLEKQTAKGKPAKK